MRRSPKFWRRTIWPLRMVRWLWRRVTLGRFARGYDMGFRYGRSVAHQESHDGWNWSPELGWHGPQAPTGLGLELDTAHYTHVEIGEHPGEIGIG